NSGMVRRIERIFRRAAPVVVFLAPGPLVCVLAGATGMNIPVFILCNVVGTVVAVTGFYYLAAQIKGPLDAFNRFNNRYWKWLLAASILVTLYWLWDQRRKGRGSWSIAEAEAALEGSPE